jgi:hypothetical protein
MVNAMKRIILNFPGKEMDEFGVWIDSAMQGGLKERCLTRH